MSAKPTFAAQASASWGDPPDWIIALAEEVDRTSQARVAKRIGYSSSVVSQAIRRCYPSDMSRIEKAVRGAFLGATHDCPVVDEIHRDQCLEEQRLNALATSATSGLRMQFIRACKTCPHSRQRAEK